MKKVLTGNYTVGYAVKMSRVEVVAAYPITPQTPVVECIAGLIADGKMDAEYVKVESEHSAMAVCIGASFAGARVFTATSAQGIALMHEMLHWAAGSRVPVVMADITRAMGPPWNIWSDHTDVLSQRDTGWLQFYCEDNQEIFDTIILGYKVCEKIDLPCIIALDAFILSHTSVPLEIYDQEKIDRFLPKYEPKYKLDTEDVHAFNGLATPEHYYELRYLIQQGMNNAKREIITAGKEFKKLFGKEYGLIEKYRCDEDIETLLIMSGGSVSIGKEAVDSLLEKNIKIGLAKIYVFRPFPKEEIRKLIDELDNLKRIIVIDRNISFGAEGIFCSETKSALCNYTNIQIYGVIAGLGGRDITIKDIENIVENIIEKKPTETVWCGLK